MPNSILIPDGEYQLSKFPTEEYFIRVGDGKAAIVPAHAIPVLSVLIPPRPPEPTFGSRIAAVMPVVKRTVVELLTGLVLFGIPIASGYYMSTRVHVTPVNPDNPSPKPPPRPPWIPPVPPSPPAPTPDPMGEANRPFRSSDAAPASDPQGDESKPSQSAAAVPVPQPAAAAPVQRKPAQSAVPPEQSTVAGPTPTTYYYPVAPQYYTPVVPQYYQQSSCASGYCR